MPKEVRKASLKKKEKLEPLPVQIARSQAVNLEQEYMVGSANKKSVAAKKKAVKAKYQEREKRRSQNDVAHASDDEGEKQEIKGSSSMVPEKMSKKIMKQILEQQREVEQEQVQPVATKNEMFKTFEEMEDEDEEEYGDDARSLPSDVESLLEGEEEYKDWEEAANFDATQEDEAELARFDKLFHDPSKQKTIHDMMMEKLAVQASLGSNAAATGEQKNLLERLPSKVIEVYTKVGLLLSRYKSGKLPKAFKIIPSLRNWEDILTLTQPEKWTPHAVFQATKVFVSNLNAKMAQRFFHLVLRDRVRAEIAETKKLSYHLYQALKKSLYKPAAFFKGILLPICEDGCTLREAVILASVLVRVSIPVLHSSAALLKIAEMPYGGGNSIFIRALLDKKYALPYRVIDSLTFHFLSFDERNAIANENALPVLWYQALLVFVQRYKEDLTIDQKEALCRLMFLRKHHQISPEVIRELMQSKSRPLASEIMTAGGDVSMMEAAPQTSEEHLKAYLAKLESSNSMITDQ